MSTYLHVPTPPLGEFVDLIWVCEGYARPHPQERLRPSGEMNLVVASNHSGRVWSVASGVFTGPATIDTSRPFDIIGVSFKAGRAFPFFPMPAGELQNQFVPLDALWGAHADDVAAGLAAKRSPVEKAAALELALLAAARGRLGGHPAVRYAVGELGRQRSVGNVVERVGLSQRRFIEVFRNEVGVTPKAFSRLRRFQKVLGFIERSTEVDWTEVALAAGYFDQAHFNHDFREFAGVNPSTYLKYRASRNHLAVPD